MFGEFNIELPMKWRLESMEVQFFSFSKRKNSTLKPSNPDYVTQVVLKKETNIVDLEIEITGLNLTAFNYAYVSYYDRYYWITDWHNISRETYRAILTCDVLATWAHKVIGQSVYAEFCSYNFNTLLNDGRITPIGSVVTLDTFFALDGILSYPNLTYVLSIAGKNAEINGCNVFVTTSSSAYQSIIDTFADSAWWTALANQLFNFNPLDFILSLHAVPFDPDTFHIISSGSCTIWNTTISGTILTDVQTYRQTVDFAIPTFYSDFRKLNHQKYEIYVPLCGTLAIPPDDLLGAENITCIYAADVISGDLVCNFFAKETDKFLGCLHSNLKFTLPLSYLKDRSGSYIASALQTTLGVVQAQTGLGANTLINGGSNILRNIVNVGENRTQGGYGSGALIAAGSHGLPRITLTAYASNVNPQSLNSIIGRPCGEIITLAQTGYVKTIDASVSFNGTRQEIEQFNNELNGGVYFE